MTIYPVYELIPTVTPTPITTPGAVTKLSATHYGYDDIILSWSKSTNELFDFAVTAVLGYAWNFAMWPCAIYFIYDLFFK